MMISVLSHFMLMVQQHVKRKPIVYRVLYIPSGAGFLPSTVVPSNMSETFHPQATEWVSDFHGQNHILHMDCSKTPKTHGLENSCFPVSQADH